MRARHRQLVKGVFTVVALGVTVMLVGIAAMPLLVAAVVAGELSSPSPPTPPLGIPGVAPDTIPAPAAAGDPNPIRRFGAALLAEIGAPVAIANLDAIDAWAAGEGSCARFNPLDTTQPQTGATPFNTLPGGGHVWNYQSFDQGVQATGATLVNGLYQPVLSALQADSGVAALETVVRQSPWGTAAFGSTAYAGRPCPG